MVILEISIRRESKELLLQQSLKMAEENTILKTIKNISIPEAVLAKTGTAANLVKDYTVSAAKSVTSQVLSSSIPAEALAKTSVIYSAVKDYTLTTAKTGSSKGLLVLKDVASGKWIARFDRPHATHTPYSHININSRLSKVPDPHIPISDATLTASKGLAKTIGILETVGEYALIAAVTIDSARLGSAIYKDYTNEDTDAKYENTVKTGSSIAATWTGGFAGGYLGSKSGAMVGGLVGSICGGAVAIPTAGKF